MRDQEPLIGRCVDLLINKLRENSVGGQSVSLSDWYNYTTFDMGLSVEKLVANAEILIIGGSETTASLLSSVTYLLLKNEDAYQKLAAEVRSTFESEDEITLISVNRLPYMLVCPDEALRMYPPIANGLPRTTPKEGAHILGQYIPGIIYVSIHEWALHRREEYFTDSDTYHPE